MKDVDMEKNMGENSKIIIVSTEQIYETVRVRCFKL